MKARYARAIRFGLRLGHDHARIYPNATLSQIHRAGAAMWPPDNPLTVCTITRRAFIRAATRHWKANPHNLPPFPESTLGITGAGLGAGVEATGTPVHPRLDALTDFDL